MLILYFFIFIATSITIFLKKSLLNRESSNSGLINLQHVDLLDAFSEGKNKLHFLTQLWHSIARKCQRIKIHVSGIASILKKCSFPFFYKINCSSFTVVQNIKIEHQNLYLETKIKKVFIQIHFIMFYRNKNSLVLLCMQHWVFPGRYPLFCQFPHNLLQLQVTLRHLLFQQLPAFTAQK